MKYFYYRTWGLAAENRRSAGVRVHLNDKTIFLLGMVDGNFLS